ncbi:FUSC family protein [Xanthobacter autotrophicus]|uniref:FUSC family protein n=1 Tax=Xanthobacter autotrophicus TaxID=280 RepID=UPI001E3051D1|nr:FUSC family protein [Xanthobacter autotrophicus]UDQ90527.1 FUSC family protein [Xanthobacter autotrophicus]
MSGPGERLHLWLAQELHLGAIARALAVIGPLVIAYLVSGEPALVNLCLLTVSLLIPALKLRLSPAAVIVQYLVIVATFALLFLAAPIPPLFVVLAGLTGFMAAAVTRFGTLMRTLGNWVFIPAVYLALDIREGALGEAALWQAGVLLGLSPVGLALVCAVQALDGRRRTLDRSEIFGPPSGDWLVPAVATAAAVFAAAVLVEMFDIREGQWLIWSAASVVVGDLSASTGKLKLRALGALVGAPLGLLIGLALPVSEAGYSFCVLGAMLTLIAFSRYVVGFGARCFFIALAAAFAGTGSGIAAERVENVLIGGAFGLVAVALAEIARPPRRTRPERPASP